MTTVWQVTWNPKLYDYEKLIQDYQSGIIKRIFQSQGMGKMVYIPQIDDLVYVSCDKKKIMKCKVKSIFKRGEEQIQDIYNLQKIRKHTENHKYLIMEIVEVYQNPEKLLGNQKTWIKIK